MGFEILVVDDSKFNIRLMTDILEKEGYNVHFTDNGNSVVDIALQQKLDVILLDVVMPGIDGFEVCKLLKSNRQTEDIPIIMITSKTDSSDVKKALELGAFDYIKKPINEVEVIARIQSAIRYKDYQQRLKEMAMRDGLTGLYNHTLLIELFQKELKKQYRCSSNIGFAMLDIDYFKRVNDNYGHLFGDYVLKELSIIISDSVRGGDIVGRYGGEEFGIVFPNMDIQMLEKVCERIRRNVDEREFNSGEEVVKVTISIGACIKAGNENVKNSEIIKKADELLYEAKKSGRNRVKIARF